MKDFLNKYGKYVLLFALLYMPIFGFLDVFPLRIWDEARQAVSAFEMCRDGDYLVNHYCGSPDMWSTKPPFLIWCQVFFMKLIGFNEVAVRLPSAIATFLTCMALPIFSSRYLKSFWFGFIAAVLLITSWGYVHPHATRSGDYDAMLTMFTTVSGLIFFAYIETQRTRYLYLFFALLVMAVLTKGVAGLLFTPAFVVYALIRKRVVYLLKNKHFYYGLTSFLIVAVGFYLLRELYNPGYIRTVQVEEWGGRYLRPNEKQELDFWFYYRIFIDEKLTDRYLLIPCGLIIGLASREQRIRHLTLFASIATVSYFLVVSMAKTKMAWYDLPLYPFMAILAGLFVYHLFCMVRDNTWVKQSLSHNVLPFLFLLLVFYTPYQKIWNKTYLPKEEHWDQEYYEIGYFLRDAINGKHNVDGQYLAFDGYFAHNLFYVYILQDKGIKFDFKDWHRLEKGDKVLAYQPEIKKFIKEHYAHRATTVSNNVELYLISGNLDPVVVTANE